MNISSDDRRLAFFNIFGEATPGQVNIIRLYPDKVCGYHMHEKQTDYYFPVSGAIQVRMDSGSVVMDAFHPAVVTVLPGTWHGYVAIGGPAIMLQYLDRKYDPTDEAKRDYLMVTH